MNKNIITLVGKDHVGIIAKVCTYLADSGINILDITQTTVQEYINMMMIVDTTECKKDFPKLESELADVGEKIGCIIKIQREDIFKMMHRV